MLTNRDEQILKAMYFYRYMTAQDVAHLFFSPKSHNHVLEILTRLAGGGDRKDNSVLYRFRMPKTHAGNAERIFTLGAEGRNVLERLGLPVNWYFRPYKQENLNYSYLAHALTLTRMLVAASYWAKQKEVTLSGVRISYGLADQFREGGNTIIPDGWILFSMQQDKTYYFPMLLEVDRGTEGQKQFKRHIASRIEFVRSGKYERMFGRKEVTICYVATGETEQGRITRCKTMMRWATDVFAEIGEDWSPVFKFAEVGIEEIYRCALFSGDVWYRPDVDKPARLFSG